LKEEKIFYKIVYYNLHLKISQSSEVVFQSYEFKQTKNGFF